MTIEINNRTITLKYTMRSLMIYEKAAKQNFNPQGLSDIIMYFFCTVLACDKDSTLSFDEFMDWLDENPWQLNEFSNWLSSVLNKNSFINNQKKEDKEGTKKKALIVHELFRVLCFEFQVMSIPYFLDELQEWEIASIVDNLNYLQRPEWERTRFQTYCNIQKSTKKSLKPSDLITFPWEQEEIEAARTISNEDIKRLQEKANKISQTYAK